jgi:hypothetical protein
MSERRCTGRGESRAHSTHRSLGSVSIRRVSAERGSMLIQRGNDIEVDLQPRRPKRGRAARGGVEQEL